MQATQMSVQDAVSDWPPDHREQATMLIDKYGQPQEVTNTHLTWFNNGPWKRTTVYKTSFRHDFPKQHKDYLKQTIDYKVPTEKACDLERFDGSVLIDRTGGELSFRCDAEPANFLGINLADRICTGVSGVEEARQQYAENISKLMQGQMTPIMQGFQFQVQHGGTGDPDNTTLPSSRE